MPANLIGIIGPTCLPFGIEDVILFARVSSDSLLNITQFCLFFNLTFVIMTFGSGGHCILQHCLDFGLEVDFLPNQPC